MKRILAYLTLSLIALFSASAAAHVTVKPGEVLTGSFQTFTVSVPNEKPIATIGIKLDIPAGLTNVTPTVKPGWTITTETEGDGELAAVKSITWNGGSIADGFRDEFTFSAKVPDETTELQWKAYQTYENGEVVSWNLSEDQQPKKDDGSPDFSNSGPSSITKVVAETEEAQPEPASVNTDNFARALGGAAVVISLVAFAVATANRKK